MITLCIEYVIIVYTYFSVQISTPVTCLTHFRVLRLVCLTLKSVLYLWLTKVSTRRKRRYICNTFSVSENLPSHRHKTDKSDCFTHNARALFNSFSHVRCDCNLKIVISQFISRIYATKPY